MLSLFFINILMVALVVGIHYESLHFLTRNLTRIKIKNRLKLVFGVFGALIAHAIEIIIYGGAYYYMHHANKWGQLRGNFSGTFEDCIYFSYTSYTTVGFGDIEALGRIRFLSGIESLTGIVLITWTASFLFLEMQRHWKIK
ncbi:two pore domain potassium channel family protein [bacterium]|jgi:hypothetical protein|nr:two pore domain potassium channel family protein [bacterium]